MGFSYFLKNLRKLENLIKLQTNFINKIYCKNNRFFRIVQCSH